MFRRPTLQSRNKFLTPQVTGPVGPNPTGPFTPTALGSKLLLWLDAADLTPGAVSSWVDKTSAALIFTQGTGANQPVMSATSFGGNPGVTFDGVNDEMTCASAPFPALTTAESDIYAVCQFLAAAGGGLLISPVLSYGATSTCRFVGVDDVFRAAGGRTSSPSTGADISTGRHLIRAKCLGGDNLVYTDTIAGLSDPSSAGVTATRTRLGAVASVAPSDYGNLVVRTIIITDGTLTAGERSDLDAYLLARV